MEKIGPEKRRLVLSDGEEVLWTSEIKSSTLYSEEILAPAAARAEAGKTKKRRKKPSTPHNRSYQVQYCDESWDVD